MKLDIPVFKNRKPRNVTVGDIFNRGEHEYRVVRLTPLLTSDKYRQRYDMRYSHSDDCMGHEYCKRGSMCELIEFTRDPNAVF